jgi:large subunit ribosomal protein L19
MDEKIQTITKDYLKKIPVDIKPGDLVRVHQKIKEGDKERIQIFEGRVIARKHGKGINATITVRRIVNNIGVEKIFPIHSPVIEKIEVVQRGKVRRAKLYYLREVSPKKARLKKIEMKEAIVMEEPAEEEVEKEEKIKDGTIEQKSEEKEQGKEKSSESTSGQEEIEKENQESAKEKEGIENKEDQEKNN